MKLIGHIIIPNVYSLYPDTMQIYYKQSVPGKENIECPLTVLAKGGPYNFLVFNFPTVERSDRKDLLSSSWLTLFFYLNGPFPCSRPFEIHPKLGPWREDE